MSTEQLENFEELGRRAVACKHWRWMPGMRYLVGSTAGRLTDNQCKGKLPLVADAMPDLRDPATLGCILALVREAHDDATIFAECHAVGDRWQCHSADGGIFGSADTEASAIVAALEAAP